ncbi:hypothetical protein QR680_007894 [Steinernema hermaphroditum]|uniref:BTB domain-containing protein n=1 Tax=Steinernema hermaphroditum TaxID=289476 RepID=A0AA39IFZ5_9BILA|nr:hypothetical protein QR680_007894 [Steinernema hermaphroditum]
MFDESDDFVKPKAAPKVPQRSHSSGHSSTEKPSSSSSDKCEVCGKNLEHLNDARRLVHVNVCLDGLEANSKAEKEREKYLNTVDCPMCGLPLQPGPFQIAHVKKCGKSHKIGGADLLKLVNTQRKIADEKKKMGSPHTKAKVPAAKATKKASKIAGMPRSFQEEQSQLALALSASISENTIKKEDAISSKAPKEDTDSTEEAGRRKRRRSSFGVVELEPRKCRCDIMDVVQERFLRNFQIRKSNRKWKSLKEVTARRARRTTRLAESVAKYHWKLKRLERLADDLLSYGAANEGDVSLIAAGDVTVKCHRVILDARTTMLQNRSDNVIPLRQFSADTIRSYLRYVYGASVEWTSAEAEDIKSLAEQYGPVGLSSLLVELQTQRRDSAVSSEREPSQLLVSQMEPCSPEFVEKLNPDTSLSPHRARTTSPMTMTAKSPSIRESESDPEDIQVLDDGSIFNENVCASDFEKSPPVQPCREPTLEERENSTGERASCNVFRSSPSPGLYTSEAPTYSKYNGDDSNKQLDLGTSTSPFLDLAISPLRFDMTSSENLDEADDLQILDDPFISNLNRSVEDQNLDDCIIIEPVNSVERFPEPIPEEGEGITAEKVTSNVFCSSASPGPYTSEAPTHSKYSGDDSNKQTDLGTSTSPLFDLAVSPLRFDMTSSENLDDLQIFDDPVISNRSVEDQNLDDCIIVEPANQPELATLSDTSNSWRAKEMKDVIPATSTSNPYPVGNDSLTSRNASKGLSPVLLAETPPSSRKTLGRRSSLQRKLIQTADDDSFFNTADDLALFGTTPKPLPSKSTMATPLPADLEANPRVRDQIGRHARILKTKNITPKPDYGLMNDQELKDHLSRFGLRPMGKKKAIALLDRIYTETHPVISMSPASYTQKHPSTSSLPTGNEHRNLDTIDEVHASDDHEILNHSTQGDNLEESIMLSPLDDEEEIEMDQARGSKSKKVKEKLPRDTDSLQKLFVAWIRREENSHLYLKVVNLQPIPIEDISGRLSEATTIIRRIPKASLIEVLDRLHVTFILPSDGWKRKHERAANRAAKKKAKEG